MSVAAISVLGTIKEMYDDPEKFIEAALVCNTSGIEARIHDWFRKYPDGIFITEIKFTEEYINANPREAFVRAMLTDASMCGGRGRDVFRGIQQGEREKYLREKIMPEYITLNELRLTIPDLSDFLKEFKEYAEKNGIPTDKRERQFYRNISSELPNAAIIELGGMDENDHLFYATAKGMIYIINYGIWGKKDNSR